MTRLLSLRWVRVHSGSADPPSWGPSLARERGLPAWLEFCLLTDVGQCLELPEGHFLVLTSC